MGLELQADLGDERELCEPPGSVAYCVAGWARILVRRLCLVQSLRLAISELDKALFAMHRMRDVVALEEQIVGYAAMPSITSATLVEAGTSSSTPG